MPIQVPIQVDEKALGAQIILALHSQDKPQLAQLYHRLGNLRELEDRIDEAGFFYTQAYVFALDCGSESVSTLHEKLRSLGREE